MLVLFIKSVTFVRVRFSIALQQITVNIFMLHLTRLSVAQATQCRATRVVNNTMERKWNEEVLYYKDIVVLKAPRKTTKTNNHESWFQG
jgi:hypothetical protein